MNFIDFFAGIGGFRKGMENAGHKCVGFCEIDKHAIASYTMMHLITPLQLEYIVSIPTPLKSNGERNTNQRQKEVIKDVYKNGEWYAKDVSKLQANDIPNADCWCFGFPCQDVSVAGKRIGFDGDRSSLFRQIMYLLNQIPTEIKPTYLLIENVKNLISVTKGTDFAEVLSLLDENGYDAEWQVVNSADYGVPQNRERIFIVGHLRGKRSSKVFPIQGNSAENNIKQLIGGRQAERLYDIEGLSVNLIGVGGGMGAKTGLYAIPVLTPDRVNKRQNGRRFKTNCEPMFTLTAQDKHGVMVEMSEGNQVYSVWVEKLKSYCAIRRLTPKECFRLQGWDDDYFHRAWLVNSDTQLYKQAGNGVTVNVVEAIAKRMKVIK